LSEAIYDGRELIDYLKLTACVSLWVTIQEPLRNLLPDSADAFSHGEKTCMPMQILG
jgi:hypothetical protein